LPVHLRRDEEPANIPVSRPPGHDRADLLAGIAAGARSAIVWVVLAAGVLAVGLRGLRRSLIAADKLRAPGVEHFQEAYYPLFFFVAFGAAFGWLVAWRVSRVASLDGPIAWSIGAVSALLLGGAGVLSASIVFAGAVPVMCWAGLVTMVLLAVGGVGAATRWLG
jgi:hypothetical protein